MKILLILMIAFLALVYIYTFLKIRKKRKNNKSAIQDFNEKYLEKKNIKRIDTKPVLDSNYKKYITKYNSQMDYISKDEL